MNISFKVIEGNSFQDGSCNGCSKSHGNEGYPVVTIELHNYGVRLCRECFQNFSRPFLDAIVKFCWKGDYNPWDVKQDPNNQCYCLGLEGDRRCNYCLSK